MNAPRNTLAPSRARATINSPLRVAGFHCVAACKQIVDAVHRLAHEAWNHELRQRRAYGAQYADQQAHAESQGHARDARQHSGAGSGIDERLILVGK